MFEKLVIFYFTGTGNALAAANWIAQVAEKKNLPAEIIQITPSLVVEKDKLSKNTLIGFCYPTHGFNAPPIVVDFLIRFPQTKNKVFLLNTRAGMKIYKIFTPGVSGLAQLLPAFILKCKGCSIIGYQPMDLPSNWISIHPGLRKKVVNSIFNRCERKTKQFAEKTIQGKRTYKGWLSFPFDIIISPISVGYYFYGRFALAKTFVADWKCNACKRCVKECPVNAIIMKRDFPYWTKKCESCMHCMNICPQRSIQTPHLFTLVLWWLVFSAIPLFFTHLFANSDSFIDKNSDIIFWGFILITGLPIIFFGYRVLHYLMRIPFLNKILAYSSLTKFTFWRRYLAPKN